MGLSLLCRIKAKTARLEDTKRPQRSLHGEADGPSPISKPAVLERQKRRKTLHGGDGRDAIILGYSNIGSNGSSTVNNSRSSQTHDRRRSGGGSGGTSQSRPSMSANLFLDPSISLFSGMDVDGGAGMGTEGSSSAGADDWTQHVSIFNSPSHQSHAAAAAAAAAMPPPSASAAAANPRLTRALLANTTGAGSILLGAANNNINNNNNNTTHNNSSGDSSSSNFLATSPLVGAAAVASSSPSAGSRVISPRPFSHIAQSSGQRDPAPTTVPSARSREREKLLSGPLMFR